ncbi:hypothetical protein Q7P36_001862 [Cladosporium allicinum]
MPKERSINPVAAQHKADKQKALAKNKKNVQSQRNDKLARRNPERLQKQIDELKELEAAGRLRPKDKETLTTLEKDLRGVKRAREALGDAAPKFAERRDQGEGGVRQEQRERRQGLGKRRRDEEEVVHEDSGSETDPEVRSIPMPRDTPPPIPGQPRKAHALPTKPVPAAPAQTVYSSAPQLRDLKKEATRFMPAAVAAQKARVKGQGRLLEPEEADRLEKAGYLAAQKAAEAGEKEERFNQLAQEAKAPLQNQDIDMEEEARRFEMEMAELIGEPPSQQDGRKTVQIEDVQDDGD